MKTRISNYIVLFILALVFVHCATKPQQRTTVDIFFFKNNNSQTDDFQNQLKQIYEPYLNINDSLIIIPEGKLYYAENNNLKFVDLNLKETVFSKLQKGGGFQTIDMVKKQAETSISNLNFNFIKLTEAISNSEKDNCLNKLFKINSYQKKIAFIPKISDSSWNEFKVIHDISSLKNTIHETFDKDIAGSILIIYNPSSDIIDKPDTAKMPPPSLSSEETLHKELLKIIDTKRSRRERENIAAMVWKDFFSPNVYVQNQMDLNDHNPENWEPGNGKSYFVHLVTLPSIIDVRILKVERDKETQKISGFTVCEIHNGSKFNH